MIKRFQKNVFQTCMDAVDVEIFDSVKGKVVAKDFFMWPPWSQEDRFKRANKWAVKTLDILNRYTEGN